MFGSIPFIQGTLSKKPEPLSRYLPPISDGIISTWLNKNSPSGSWILDPFGASPKVALDAARAGYRLLITANNPITRFLLEIMAAPPTSDELKGALAALAASYAGDQRIEPHIRSLYDTVCARCGQTISAEYFLWEHGNPSPSVRCYSCPNCGDTGEHACTAQDIELSSRFSSSGPHRARALERVVSASDPDRTHVEQALSVYIPRALFGLITIINKIEGLNISPHAQNQLSALLLYAFDQANAMWKASNQPERRRQLTIPPHFRENNIWFALEEGINLWAADDISTSNPEVVVTTWPDLPPDTGGICIYEGRFLSLVNSLKDIKINSVCTAIPRPNQAFWTLSALWAGWLWGREAVGTFKSVLRRQRYDWAWHTTALSSVFKQLATILSPNTKMIGLIGEAEPGFIGAALVAAGMTGYRVESVAIRPEEEQAQIIWQVENNREISQISLSMAQSAAQSAIRFLELTGEPETYLATISAAMMGIIRSLRSTPEVTSSNQESFFDIPNKVIDGAEQVESSPPTIYAAIYNSSREALSYRTGFLRYSPQLLANAEITAKNQISQSSLFSLDIEKNTLEEEDVDSLEISSSDSDLIVEKERPARSSDIPISTLIWLRDADGADRIPISDRYELTMVAYLIDHPGCTIQQIDEAMCEAYPGLFTPPLEFVQLCLESYANHSAPDVNNWHLRPEDNLDERLLDLEQAAQYLHQIGKRLGYICADRESNLGNTGVTWSDDNGFVAYWFFPSITAAIGESVLYCEKPPVRGYIVLPGSRANLVIYKLRHDPRLARAFNTTQGNWRFLKFRHLRSLVESPVLNRDNLEQLLSLDPITYSTPQLWLI